MTEQQRDSSTTPPLRTVGILGGMSSEATITYYRRIDAGINDVLGGHHAGNLLIRSVNFGEIEQYIRSENWEAAAELLVNAAMGLEAGGADFVVMATNTMHRIAPEITEALSIPFLHIVDVTADAIREAGVDTVGVLGTKATMEGAFYRNRFSDHGIDVEIPDESKRGIIDAIIFDELTSGEIRDDSRDTYLAIIDELVQSGAGGIVLGCTEIDLLINQTDRPDIPMFDTTDLHIERAVERSLSSVDFAGIEV